MRLYPALRLTFFDTPTQDQLDHLLADLDGFHPTAIDDVARGVIAYFAGATERDRAFEHFSSLELVDAIAEEVADGNWAERSQAALTAVTARRLTIAPPWSVTDELRARAPGPIIVIQPSMGFGTGHHASTRLCLELLQQIPLEGKRVLDIGTGSGVLAIAARCLGAGEVRGVDVDQDALANARENLALNPAAEGVVFEEFDLASVSVGPEPGYDVLLANLTGAMLERDAARISLLAGRRADLVISGFQIDECPVVIGAFQGWQATGERVESTWVGAHLVRP